MCTLQSYSRLCLQSPTSLVLSLQYAGGRNFSIPIPGAKGAAGASPGVDTSNDLVRQIADAESSDQWTLMHRFNRAADLLDQALTVRPIYCQAIKA